MPTYAYMCRDCGTALEVQQAFTDDALTVCPTCGGRLRKQYGSVGVTFNGSGFYRTDSRSGGEKGAASADASKASPSESKSGESKSGESKPAAPAAAPSSAPSSAAAKPSA